MKKQKTITEGAVITDRFHSKAMANNEPTWADELQQDNLFVHSELVNLSSLLKNEDTVIKRGVSKALVCEGEIVNIVSPGYGHMPNETFFIEAERKLIEADVKYVTRSVNRRNRSFSADYILNDPSYHVALKIGNGSDKIMPMLRFTNAYDGSGPVSGSFGFYRAVCSNGLMLAQTKIGFRVLHRSKVTKVLMPRMDELVKQFMDNEYYTLMKKFEVLAERPIENVNEFVKYTATKLDLFKFEKSEKNPDEPSAAAQIVIDTINREAGIIGAEPTLWLGYNAFNEAIHKSQAVPFARQKKMDGKIFETVLEMAN